MPPRRREEEFMADRPRIRESGRTDAPRVRQRPGTPLRPKTSSWKIAFRAVLVVTVLVSIWYVNRRVDRFLTNDERFQLSEAGAPIVEGVRYASMEKIAKVFAADLGHSVYGLPLAQRRKSLLDIDWIREVSVARLWPNQVIVRIAERQPIAFLPLPSQKSTRFGLIDGEGVVLEQPLQAQFTLPVLVGVQSTDLLSVRKDRVRRLRQLVTDLGSRAEKISEVDVAETNNLKVTMPAGSRMVTLYLGDQNFAQRMQNYLDHATEIRKKVPNAKTVDLRIEDRITVLD
jgi:cell division protein FtsQ